MPEQWALTAKVCDINIFIMLPLCNYCACFATRVNKMAADTYCVKKLTFLLVVIDHCKIAHIFRLEKNRNFTHYEFFSKTNISPHFGGKHENQFWLDSFFMQHDFDFSHKIFFSD